MTKLSIARIFGECSLGSGCIAGGVEAAKAGVKVKEATEDLRQKNIDLEKKKKHYEEEYKKADKWNQNLKKENEGLKGAVKYSKQQFHNIYVHTGDVNALRNHAKDAKHGIRKELEKDDKATDYARELN